MGCIYIIVLQRGYFYIGWTDREDPMERIEDHYCGRGVPWTKLHPPLKNPRKFAIHKNQLKVDEEKWTLLYMSEWGIESVRGGAFCSIELEEDDKKILNKMISSIQNKCYICNDKYHYASSCPNYQTPQIDWKEDYEDYYNFS